MSALAPSKPTMVATNLYEVMRQQERSLIWLSRRMGLSRSYISRIAGGTRPATHEVAHRCSDLLGLPVHLLFAERPGSESDAA